MVKKATPHDMIVQKYINAGYETTDFRLFLKMWVAAVIIPGIEQADVLATLRREPHARFSTIKNINKYVSAYFKDAPDDKEVWLAEIDEEHTPHVVPDAWRVVKPSAPGVWGDIEVVEVIDTNKLSKEKLEHYFWFYDSSNFWNLKVNAVYVDAPGQPVDMYDAMRNVIFYMPYGRNINDNPIEKGVA
jgi:hypothetical protein